MLEVTGGPGRLTRDSFRELWHFREVQLAFAARQLKVRYKQAVVGAGWVVLQPLVGAAIFALFLGRYANVSSEGVSYFLLALAGMTCWGYFSSAANTGAFCTMSPRAVLTRNAPGFMRAISAAPIIPRVSGVSGE